MSSQMLGERGLQLGDGLASDPKCRDWFRDGCTMCVDSSGFLEHMAQEPPPVTVRQQDKGQSGQNKR